MACRNNPKKARGSQTAKIGSWNRAADERKAAKKIYIAGKRVADKFCQEPLDKVARVKTGADPMRDEGRGGEALDEAVGCY